MCFFIDPAIYRSVVRPATADTPLAERIASYRSYMPYFKHCVGAVDGTYIPVSLSTDDNKAAWCNCDEFTSQNVLAICDFDLYFTNALFGWERSAADSTLWLEANRSAIVKIPQEKYLLGDAGFQNCNTCLVLYHNVRYHLQEWTCGIRGPQSAEELFNMCHSKLSNVVEHIFSVRKARFNILIYPPPFKMKSQVWVVAALCILHNILNDFDEEEGVAADNDTIAALEDEGADDDAEHIYNIFTAEVQGAVARCNIIAEAMWADYCAR